MNGQEVSISPQVMRDVMKEISGLVKDPPEDIKVNVNDADLTNIHAEIIGPCKYFNVKRGFTYKFVLYFSN